MSLMAGSSIGHYAVVSLIGAGGMGEVYRARDTRLDRDVALKVLSRGLQADEDALRRFEQEARAVAALSHPNILAIHDFAVHEGLPYTVTELLEGESLRERIARGPLGWREATELAIAIAEGIASAHQKGIVHRDLKPENVFLTKDGRVKILDFGLARSAHEGALPAGPHDPSAPTRATPTDHGLVLGTIGYMSPEQARGLPVGKASDIFSLGCVLYEVLTGRRAFDGPTPTDTLAAVLHDPPAPLSASGRHAPPELARIVTHCLEKNPAVRFQSSRDLAFALRAVLNDSGVQQTAASRARGARALSMAVLPFANESGDADLEYLAEGLTESLINTLAQLPRTRVVPRGVVFRHKGRVIDPRAMGVELNATRLVTGRVVARAGQISVQVELVDAETESQIWGQRYVRPLDDLFALQLQLADEISDALRGRLRPKAKTRGKAAGAPRGEARAPESEAYQEYLRGRHAWNRWSPEGFAQAIEHFERAIDRDPAFASAWAGLADGLGAAGYFGHLPAGRAMPRAVAAAERAIAIDASLAEGHAALAMARFFWQWDFTGAREAFDRAFSLNPHYALARVYRSLFFASQGQFDESVAEARRAEQADPLSPVSVSSVGWALLFAGRIDEAHAHLHGVLDDRPESADALGMMIGVHEELGDFAGAVVYARRWARLMGVDFDGTAALQGMNAADGTQGYWRSRVALLEAGMCQGGPHLWARAECHAALGESDVALDCLEAAFEERIGALVFLAIDRRFAPLHGKPRFERLRDRIGLPKVGPAPRAR